MTDMNSVRHRIKSKREITKERRLAAEEKKRLEEDKAKVKKKRVLQPLDTAQLCSHSSQMGARKAARLRRKAGRSKKINH